jgi:ribonuclease HII
MVMVAAIAGPAMRFGVDEAGKGPVLGSMFAAAVVADPDDLPGDVGDSKDVAPERRTQLEGEIRSRADGVAVAEVPVTRIDDPGTDMNTLTVEAHAAALERVVSQESVGPPVDEEPPGPRPRHELAGLVDAGDTNADRFGRRVADRVDAGIDVAAEHGADATDPLVGAASIVAKEAREVHVASLRESFGDVGSGYPSDPTTRGFLWDWVDEHGQLPTCARASWETSRAVLAAAEQAGLGEF